MIPVMLKEKPLATPQKRPLAVPTEALAGAITTEWEVHQKFMPGQMPLTALAYTAIDRVEGQRENIVEVLLAYVDTDTICYRSQAPAHAARQSEAWDPVVGWAGRRFGAIWQVTTGIMPIEQSSELHESIRSQLGQYNAMELAALCVLATCCSSLILALALKEGEISAEQAFALARLEEEIQAESWGRDEEAEKRAARVKSEILAAGRFLRLLKAD